MKSLEEPKNLARSEKPEKPEKPERPEDVIATSPRKLVLGLARANALHILPERLFHADGTLRPIAELWTMYVDQLERLDKPTRTMLETNRDASDLESWRVAENLAVSVSTDAEWFREKFKISDIGTPNSLRAFFLQQHINHLHWFIDHHGEPWSDVAKLLALVRYESTKI